MNNLASRLFFAFLGGLFILNFIFNKWVHQELAETLKPAFVVSVNKTIPAKAAAEEYDMNSDYPPSASGFAPEPLAVVNKRERVLDEKIIYEMPTSNKFLLQ